MRWELGRLLLPAKNAIRDRNRFRSRNADQRDRAFARRTWRSRRWFRRPARPTDRARSILAQHFAQRGDAFAILLHRADRNADPLGQIVTFQSAHDDPPLRAVAEKRRRRRRPSRGQNSPRSARTGDSSPRIPPGNRRGLHRSGASFPPDVLRPASAASAAACAIPLVLNGCRVFCRTWINSGRAMP